MTATAGVDSTPLTVQIINNKNGAGASDLVNARLKALFRNDGETAWKGADDEWPDRHYLEVRRETGGWNTNFSQSEWIDVGAGATFPLPRLANDEGVKISIRVSTSPDAQADVKEFTFRLEQAYGEATSVGVTEVGKAGIYLGLDDRTSDFIVANPSGDAVESGSPDQNVNIGDVVWVSRGRVYADLAQAINHPLAASAKERYDLVHLDENGAVTKVAGSEVTGPLTDADKPAIPAGSSGFYYVEVDDTGPITNSLIENIWSPLGYFGIVTSSASLIITLGGGRAVIDNSRITNIDQLQLTLPASDESWVWMLRNGNLTSTLTEDPPLATSRPMLLYQITTDGSGVTAVIDRRSFQGERIQRIDFEWLGEIVVDDWRYSHLQSWRGGQVLPLLGIIASFGTQVVGSGLSGQTRWDVEVEISGSWTTLFTVGGDNQPEIAYDATDLRALAAIPELYAVPPNARIRAAPSEIPTGTVTTDPQDARLSLLVAC
jgi:hypothetical protein